MAISYSAAGAVVANATSAAVAYPTGIAAGDLLLLTAVSKYSAYTSAPPTGFTLLAEQVGGSGGTGVDVGDVRVAVWYRVADGSETGSVNVTKATQTGSVILARMFLYKRTAGAGWNFQVTSGVDSAGGLGWSVTGSSNIILDAGDLVVAVLGANTDAPAFASHAITATGSTFGALTERQDSGTTTGDDVRLVVVDGPVSTGPSSAAPTFTSTASAGTPEGATIIVRLREARVITADLGTFTLSGQAAGLQGPPPAPFAWASGAWASGAWYGTSWYTSALKIISAARGTFTLTGQDAALKMGRRLIAAQGGYTLSGQTANTARGVRIAADAGSYALTGQAATLNYVASSNRAWIQGAWATNAWVGTAWHKGQQSLTAARGTYAITGQDVTFRLTRIAVADRGNYLLSGQDATLTKGQRKIIAEQGSYAATGYDANFFRSNQAGKAWKQGAWYSGAWYGTVWADDYGGLTNYSMVALNGEFDIVGQDANLEFGRRLGADTGFYTYTGDDALRDLLMRAETGSYALNGQAAGGGRGRPIAAAVGTYFVSGRAANLARGYRMTAAVGSFVVEGQNASFVYGDGIAADAGAYTLFGQDASLKAAYLLSAGTGQIVLTGHDATFNAGQVLGGGVGYFTLTGGDATLSRTRTIIAEPGYYSISGQVSGQEIAPVEVERPAGGYSRRRRKLLSPSLPTPEEIQAQREALGILPKRAQQIVRAEVRRITEGVKSPEQAALLASAYTQESKQQYLERRLKAESDAANLRWRNEMTAIANALILGELARQADEELLAELMAAEAQERAEVGELLQIWMNL